MVTQVSELDKEMAQCLINLFWNIKIFFNQLLWMRGRFQNRSSSIPVGGGGVARMSELSRPLPLVQLRSAFSSSTALAVIEAIAVILPVLCVDLSSW